MNQDFHLQNLEKKPVILTPDKWKISGVNYGSGELCLPLKYYCSLLAWIYLILSYWAETFVYLCMTLRSFLYKNKLSFAVKFVTSSHILFNFLCVFLCFSMFWK